MPEFGPSSGDELHRERHLQHRMQQWLICGFGVTWVLLVAVLTVELVCRHSRPQELAAAPAAEVQGKLEEENDQLREQLVLALAERDEARSQIQPQVQLAAKLRDELGRKDAALDDALARCEDLSRRNDELLAESSQPLVRESAEPALVAREPLVEAINQLLLEAAFTTYRLLHVDAVRDRTLAGTVWSLCNERGTAIGGVRAERCRVDFDPVARTALFVLEEGYVSKAGERSPFTGGKLGFVVAGVEPERWLSGALRDLADLGGGPISPAASKQPVVLDDESKARVVESLRELLRPEGYDVVHVGRIEGGVLVGVRFERADPSGHGTKAIEARRCRIFRVLPSDYIELSFQEGHIEDRGGERPFVGDAYRVPLPGLDTRLWQKSLGDLVVDRS
ncbi:MAG: hypothetical protein AB1486_13405 [Planctomycetota bacterium]